MNRWLAVLSACVLTGALSSQPSAAKTPDGKPIFIKYKCNSCHSIDAAAIVKKAASEDGESTSKMKPPDLSDVGLKKKADWIALFLTKKEKLEGELHPKKFRGTDTELKTIAAWLETMKTEKAKEKAKDKAEAKPEAKPEAKAEGNPAGEKSTK
jgi:mono/diheme cytochrome c family protein